MTDILSDHSNEFNAAVEFLRNDIFALRTGRANPQMVENVMIDAYDSRSPLASLAGITTPDARSILIEPWDKSIVKAIEKGILEAKLGFNPMSMGTSIRINIPAPTEENRKQLVKTLGEKLEHARTSVRRVRDEARASVQKANKDSRITEDEKYKLLEQLDKTAAGANDRIRHIGEEKEKEIMTI